MKRIPKWSDELKAEFCQALHDKKRPEGTFDFVFLDGYMRAMCCAPAVLAPVSWTEEVFARQPPNFDDREDAQPFYAGLLAMYNHQMEQVIEGQCELPVDHHYSADATSRQAIENWCAGFLQGYAKAEPIWDEMILLYPEPEIETERELLPIAEQIESILDVIATVADSDAAVKDGLAADELPAIFDSLKDNIILCGLIGQGLLTAESEAGIDNMGGAGFHNEGSAFEKIKHPVRRDTPKVGRNDLCPCGSGKRFKNCCMA